MSPVAVMRGAFIEAIALGPTFSSQVWSTVWLAMAWPRRRLSFGAKR